MTYDEFTIQVYGLFYNDERLDEPMFTLTHNVCGVVVDDGSEDTSVAVLIRSCESHICPAVTG